MNRYLIDRSEAEWTPDEKVWAGIEQFAPRKWRWQSIAVVGFTFVFGLAAMFCVVVAIGASR